MAADVTLRPAQLTAARDATDVRIATMVASNTSDHRLCVWTTPRALTYDAGTRTLSVRFAENPDGLGDDVRVISTHPRVPTEAWLDPGEETRLQVRIPPVLQVIDLGAQGPGLGLTATQVPVGEIDRITVDVATSDVSFAEVTDLPVEEMVPQLRARSRITTTTVDASPLQSHTPNPATDDREAERPE